MEDQEYEQDEWKIALHTEFLTAMTGNPVEKVHACEKVGYYYQCCAPASLCKYYGDIPEKFDAVQNNKMWYSAPCNFNDVFDCEISVDDKKVFNEALKFFPDKRGIRPGSPAWKKIRATIHQQLRVLKDQFDDLRTTTGVSCLSESNDSLLMWAHYANNHRGICIEYDLLEINSALKFTPVPVIYSEKRTCFDFLNPQNMEYDVQQLLIRSLTSKSPEWRYEKEWRIIQDHKACGDQWNADKKGALLEMIRPNAIYLGCAAKPEFEKEVKEYCLKSRINLYKMEKDPIQYKLNKKIILKFGENEE